MKKLITILSIVLAFGLSTTALAGGLGLKAIAPQVGLVMPEDLDTGFHVGAKANMGEVAEGFGLYPFVGYWASKYSWSGYGLAGEDISLSNIQIGADVHYHLADVDGLYFGGGLSLNLLSWNYPDEYKQYYAGVDNSDTKIGFGLLAGYELPIGNNLGFVQGKYNIISDLNTLELTVGIYFKMGK